MASNMRTGSVERKLCHSAREELRRLCSLTNLQLLDFMEQQILSPPDAFDEELFDAAQALLDERAPLGEEDVQEESFASFRKRHEEVFTSTEQERQSSPHSEPPRKKCRRTLPRIAAVFAAMVALFCASAVATGNNPVTVVMDAGETLVRIVSLGSSGKLVITNNTSLTDYSSLEEALSDLGFDNAETITWIPPNMSLATVTVRTTQGRSGVSAVEIWAYYESSDASLVYNIAPRPHGEKIYYSEKDPTATSNSISESLYDVTTNRGWIEIQWSDNNFDYALLGNISSIEMENIISSLK